MEPPGAISVKVEKLLGEIRALKIQLEESTTNPERATSIQCEIHRKFAILDWAKSVRSQLAEESCTELDRIWTLVANEREDANATKDDLEKMQIPPRKKESENEQVKRKENEEQKKPLTEEDPFQFMDLPELVVREKVLSYLTSPQDKLNVWEGIPSVGNLMGWQKTTLHFESIVPILMQQRGKDYNPLLDWTDLYNLSRVTPFLRDYIKNDYKERPTGPTLSLTEMLEQVSSGLNDPKWARSSIFPAELFLRLENEDAEEEKRLMTNLNQVGARICKMSLCLTVSKTPFQTLKRLAGILSRTPNVNRLMLSLEGDLERESDNRENEEWEWRSAENIELPELPSIRELDLVGQSQLELVRIAMLQICGKGLRDLFVLWKGEQSSKPLLWDQVDKIHCPHLSSWFFQWGEYKDISFDLNLLADSPLKIISLEVNEKTIGQDFIGLLVLLDRHFGDTLERLDFHWSRLCKNEDQDDKQDQPSAIPPTWMLDAKFPKPKSLMIQKLTSPISWYFLLLFPSLEELRFELLEQESDVDFGRDENILGLSFNWEEMINANIWKLLPNLDKYSVSFKDRNQKKSTYLERSVCLYFQQKGSLSSS